MMKKYKILIVDDEIKLLDRLKRLLEMEGYQVSTAENGRAVTQMMEEGCFDLVITDLMMPKMNGYEVMNFVGKHCPETMVVVLTAHASVESVVKALRSGAYDYIVKPVRMGIVKEVVKRACERIELQKQLMEATRQLQILAVTDDLTNVYNQRYFKERLTEEFERTQRYSQPLSCMMIDVDRFKTLNDTYGHLEGDKILKKIAQVIKESIRSSDLLARYGGDEFILLLPQTPSDKAFMVAERIKAGITDNFASSYQELGSLTVSLGISTIPNPEVKEETDLVSQADKALYAAKRAGRNCIEIIAD